MTSAESITPNFTLFNYAQFFGAGALAATATHGVRIDTRKPQKISRVFRAIRANPAQAATPIDVVKTRIQVDESLKGQGMLRAGRSIVAGEGAAALLTGFGPTAVGYLVQGGGKFMGYEFFKKKFIDWSGSEEVAIKRRMPIYLGASATAEFFADIALCPLEATRIRLVSQRGFASGLASGFMRLAREEGFRGFYSGFVPLLFKQVPYAVGQFSVHEVANEAIFRAMGPERKAKLSHIESTGVELTSGIIAGAAAAILSHPADTLLSAINKGSGDKTKSTTSRMFSLAAEIGPVRLLTSGLGPRIIMTCGLVAGQFVIYAQCKTLVSAPPSIEIHKEEKL